MRIAYFSPLPPKPTGIADYSQLLLTVLSEKANVYVFTDDVQSVNKTSHHNFPINDIDSFQGPIAGDYDICLYQMGNNQLYHQKIYQTLIRFPGVTTLHDLNLNSFFGELYLKHNRVSRYVREMAYAYGIEGARYARIMHQTPMQYDTRRYPLFARVTDISRGIITHSRYGQRTISNKYPQTPVVYINQPTNLIPCGHSITQVAKKELGYKSEDIVLASFGYIAPSKRIDVILKAIAILKKQFPTLRYLLVGQIIDSYDIKLLIKELKIEDNVQILGYVDTKMFQVCVRATDIGINLRYPTNGETSATLLNLMAAGKPTFVSNIDAFSELPDDACIKIDIGSHELSQLIVLLRALIKNQSFRWKIGQYAQQFIAQYCQPQHVAQQYIDFLNLVSTKR